jgi:MFS transporter, DHA2 family, multidrug resistance protein
MSAGATRADVSANPWLVAVLVAFATFMEVLDTTIANVALRYIAGGLGVSEDEASWVVTTYLVSNAIILTASAFLAKKIGHKTFFLICLALFTASSVLCVALPGICSCCCSASCRAWVAAAWCRSQRRSWWMRSPRQSAARP